MTQTCETDKRKSEESNIEKNRVDRDFDLAQRKLDEKKLIYKKFEKQVAECEMNKRRYEEHARSLESSIKALEPQAQSLEKQIRDIKTRLVMINNE